MKNLAKRPEVELIFNTSTAVDIVGNPLVTALSLFRNDRAMTHRFPTIYIIDNYHRNLKLEVNYGHKFNAFYIRVINL